MLSVQNLTFQGVQLSCAVFNCAVFLRNVTIHKEKKMKNELFFLNKEVVTKQNLSEFGVRYVSSGDFISCSLFIST